MISLIIILLYSAINFVEAWLEDVVIELKDPRLVNYRELNNEEHFRSLVYAILIAGTFCIAALHFQLYWLIIAIVFNRRIFFNYFLKRFRNRDTYLIEGDGWFDIHFKKVFGEDGGMRELYLEVFITLFSIIMTFMFN